MAGVGRLIPPRGIALGDGSMVRAGSGILSPIRPALPAVLRGTKSIPDGRSGVLEKTEG